MYRKLLKHDWRSTRSVLGILCLACLIASILGGFAMRTMILLTEASDPPVFLIVTTMMALVMSFIAIGVCTAGSLFFLIWRFYRSRYSDEGYMTFTLPVTTHQVLLSSLTNTALSMLLMGAAAMLGFGILTMIGMTAVPDFYSTIFLEFPQVWDALCRVFQEEMGPFVSMFLYTPVFALAEIIVMMLSVTIGSVVVRKYKVLAAVGIYYGINMVVSFIVSIITAFSGVFLAGDAQAVDAQQLINHVFLAPTLIMAAIGIGGYFLMHFLTDRKLNLP